VSDPAVRWAFRLLVVRSAALLPHAVNTPSSCGTLLRVLLTMESSAYRSARSPDLSQTVPEARAVSSGGVWNWTVRWATVSSPSLAADRNWASF